MKTEENCTKNVFHWMLWDPGQINIMGRYHSMQRMSLLLNSVYVLVRKCELVLLHLVLPKSYDN